MKIEDSKRTPVRRAAAVARLAKAMELVEEAQHTLEAACRELCPIVGGIPLYRRVSKLADLARVTWGRLDAANVDRLGLDHEPDPARLTEPPV